MLRDKIEESGYKIGSFASRIGLTHQGFLRKLRNDSEFKASEIYNIRIILHLTSREVEQIFFDKKGGKMPS